MLEEGKECGYFFCSISLLIDLRERGSVLLARLEGLDVDRSNGGRGNPTILTMFGFTAILVRGLLRLGIRNGLFLNENGEVWLPELRFNCHRHC